MRIKKPAMMTKQMQKQHPLVQWLAQAGRWRALLLALLAGALVAAGFEPIAFPGAPIIGVALFLLLLSSQPKSRAPALGLAFGFGQFAFSLHWIAQAFTHQSAMPAFFGWIAVALLSLCLAIYPALAALAVRLSARIVPLTLIFAALFTWTEILRGLLLTGFAWNPLGAAWLPLPGISGFAAIIGSNGLSALMILAGGSLAALIGARGEAHRLRLVLVFPVMLGLGIAIPRIQQPLPPATDTQLLLVQTGIGIDDKYADGGAELGLVAAIGETRKALKQNLKQGPAPAAVIWPEAAVQWAIEELPDLRAGLVRDFPASTLLLTGGISIERDQNDNIKTARNSLFALDAQGEILTRYDKAHLVPGGEYLPLRTIAEPLGLARLVPGDMDFERGPGPQTFRLPGLPAVGPDICYEIIFPGAVVDRRDRPDFILTISNDAWFGPAGPPQHHAQARLRAIEEGLPVVRVTPTGLSGIIDARGGLTLLLPRDQAAAMQANLPARLPDTPFARAGLLAPAGLALLLLGLGLMAGRDKS